jgi:hypothetical protein
VTGKVLANRARLKYTPCALLAACRHKQQAVSESFNACAGRGELDSFTRHTAANPCQAAEALAALQLRMDDHASWGACLTCDSLQRWAWFSRFPLL